MKKKPGGRRTWCALVTLDVKNAFNSVSWPIIIKELHNRNISKYLVNLIIDYFGNRRIKIDKDEEFEMTAGIPQGSVLGPLLWNLQYDFILSNTCNENVKVFGYADDIALLVNAPYHYELMELTNKTINKITVWLADRSLNLAAEKTEAVILKGKRDRKHIRFKVENVEITPKKAVKHLGVIIGENMRFTEHAKYISE